MDCERIATIAREYPWASWAVWDDVFPEGDCVEEHPERLVEFIQARAEKLTPDIVFLGLNRSAELPAPYSNFHSPSRTHYDYRLKEFIQDGELNRLHGAYMTDLVDSIDSDSHSVTVTNGDVAILTEQLAVLDQSEYHVVCFGNKAFDGLVGYFDGVVTASQPELKHAIVESNGWVLNLYRVWFYGLYGANQDKVAVFQRQLESLNEQID